MEFLSPKTKEHIESLEKTNEELRLKVNQLSARSSKTGGQFWIVATVVLALLCAYIYFFHPQFSDEKIAAIQVELWTENGAESRVLTPTDGVEFSVQIGSFKNMDFNALAKSFVEANTLDNDSLTALIVGNYSSLVEAQKMHSVLVSLGLENAFIVAHKDGKNVGLLSNKTAN